MRKILLLLLPVLLTGCWPCETTLIDNGPLPDSVLKYIPYENGSVYKFKHSNGLVVGYETARETTGERSYCVECCKYEYKYESNHTELKPDYPIFNIQFDIDNQDTAYIQLYASVGKYGFYIPTNTYDDYMYYEKVDSLLVDTAWYYQVYKLKSNYDDYYTPDLIYVDSIYYNFNNGILKIIMSNDESYTIY